MKKLLGLLLGTILFALLLMFGIKVCAAPASAQSQPAQENPADDNATALTIYNQNFFVAREHVPLDLKPGINHAEFAGIAAHLEPDSVILRDPNGRALQILEQNYRNDPVSPEMLLSFYEGKTIDFVVGRSNGKEETIKGKIVRSGYVSPNYIQGYPQPASTQPIVEVDGVLRFGLPGQPIFPALSADSILKPTLSWLLQTDTPGKFNAEISYVSAGMNWQSDYNIVVQDQPAGKSDLLDMIGWITMRNHSGKTFEDAHQAAGGRCKQDPGAERRRTCVCCESDGREWRCDGPGRPRKILRRISPLHASASYHSARRRDQASGVRTRDRHSRPAAFHL
jgi:hypothetical protein